MKDKKVLERWRNRPSTSNGRNDRRKSNSDYFQDDSEFSFHNNGQKQESQKGRKYNARTCISAVTGLEMRKTELPSESHYLAGGPPAVKSKFSDKDKGNRPKPRNRDKPSGPLQKARAEQGHSSTSVRDSTRHIGTKVTNLEEASPSPIAQFFSAGLDAGRTVLDVGKTVCNNAYNTLTQMNSKRSSEQPQPSSNKRQKRTSGQDSLVAFSSAPTDSIGRRKRSRPEAKSAPIPKNQVIDLVDSDEDTEEDNVTRPLFTDVEKAKAAVAESSPQKKQQESEQKRSHNLFTDVWRDRAEQKAKQKQVGVFDMIHEVAREVKTPPDEEKISTTTYGLRQDLSDTEDSGLKTQESESNSDIDKTLRPQHQPVRSEMETFEANDGNQAQENDENARCSKEPQHQPSREYKGPRGNSAGETSEEEANGGNQTEGDSEYDDPDFSLLPKVPARKSKSTAILQRPFEALKNRINPGLDYQQHCKVSRSDAERREPEHQTSIILEDDESENDGATANITNDLFPHGTPKPLLRHPGGPEKDPGMKFHINTENSKMPATSPLPPDLLAPDPGNVDDMMEGFDLKSNQWKNGAKPSASRKHGRGADDEEDFWGDVTNTERKNKSKNGSSYSPDDAKASVAARKLAETDNNLLVDSDDEVSPSRTDTTDWNNPIRKLTRQRLLHRAGIEESSPSGGFSLTKRNGHQRSDPPKRKKGTRVVPGESTSGIFKTFGTRSTTRSDYEVAKKLQEDEHRRAFSTGRSRTLSSAENSDYELNKGLQEKLLAESRDKMTGRIPRKKKKLETTSDDPIVLSSDSEEENQVDDRDQEYDLFRVALGKKVFHNRCRLTFSRRRNEISLEFPQAERKTRNSNSNSATVQFKLNQDTLRIFRFYQNKRVTKSDLSDSDDDEHVETSADFSFVAIQVTPHASNNLDLFPNVYKGDAADAPDNTRYIVLEFEQDQDFHYFRTQMESHLQPILPPGDLKKEQSYKYAGVLIKHSRKATNIQKAKQIQSAFLNGRSEVDTLLVFPFAGDPAQIDGAADGLHEPSGKLKTNRGDISEGLDEEPEEPESKKPPSPSASSADATKSKEGEPEEQESKKPPSLSTSSADATDSKEGEVPKVKVRQHYVTLCVKDYQRLQPEEWLNDSLVDFWMQWISRKEDKSNTNLHFFTSHFYSKLSKNGPKAVTSWTAKKHINIFEKKFIFIPINKDLHWSQCVVVNPGKIMNAYESDHEKKAKLDVPCLIFMDSLKMHKKEKIRKQIENWLNSEWTRLHPDDDGVGQPFSRGKFELFSPKVPMQNNTWDCGVFVCRYALAIFLLRNRSFTYGEVHRGNSPFSKLVTGGAEFDFDMDDIVRFRGEFQTLIERLSGVYEQWKRNPHPKIEGEKTTYKQEVNPKTQGGNNETSYEQGMDTDASMKTSDEQEGNAELQGGNNETNGEQGMDGEATKETSDDQGDNRKTQGAENATGDEQVMNGQAKKDDEETGISSDDSGPIDKNGYLDV